MPSDQDYAFQARMKVKKNLLRNLGTIAVQSFFLASSSIGQYFCYKRSNTSVEQQLMRRYLFSNRFEEKFENINIALHKYDRTCDDFKESFVNRECRRN